MFESCFIDYHVISNHVMPIMRFKAKNITEFINSQLDNMTDSNGIPLYTEDDHINVWPYAIYYPYYEQYTTMTQDAIFQLGVCLIPAFAFTFILLGKTLA